MRYFLGFLVAIGLIIFVIFLLFHSGGKKVPVTQKTLPDYSTTDAAVTMTIDGPINADQLHQSVEITVNNNSVVYQQFQGYQGTVVNQQSFASNESAYAVFLRALNYAGFTKGNISKTVSDERGYCPLGNRYIFELTQDGSTLEHFWSTSCGNPKTYLGNLNITIQLFKNQVPGYNTLTQNIAF